MAATAEDRIPEKRCWVTGAGGLIGSHIVRTAPGGWRPIALTRNELDITDREAVRLRFFQDRPDMVIHCAAMSRTTDCERDPQLAWRINHEATQHLCELAKSIPLLFFSTDLVFDGARGNYVETDSTGPVTLYGETKAAAERTVLLNPAHTVLRASLTGGTSPRGHGSFTEQLIDAWTAGSAPRLFMDEFRSPLMAEVTARATWELAAARQSGIFHLGGAERLSRFVMGELLARRMPALHPKIIQASLKDYAGPARAPDTSLISDKLQSLLTFRLPKWSEWLEANWPFQS